ncbi:MAG: ABC transporter permease [Hyphomicrobiales bacterium]|nr:ABC transporter permease [Hyphomicrobiales bacterium]
MLHYVLKRIGGAILVLVVVALIAFVLFRFVGDPINQMVGQDVSVADRERLRQMLGLDDSIVVQLARFLWNALHFDFGVSYQFKEKVTTLVAARFPATFELSLAASIFAIVVGIPVGAYTGIRPKALMSRAFMALSLIGVSLPTFLIGILLIYVFAVRLQWLPSYGRGETVQIGFWRTGFLTKSGLAALVMPSITLGLFQLTLIARLVRAEMLEVMRADFIRFARARGLSERAVNFRHALKNTLVPVVTIIGLQIGSIVAFSIITETVFQWPGMGLLFITSVQNADIPVMAAYLMMVAIIFVTINLTVDLLYLAIDPRIRLGSAQA